LEILTNIILKHEIKKKKITEVKKKEEKKEKNTPWELGRLICLTRQGNLFNL
jgi:hypothetical protein